MSETVLDHVRSMLWEKTGVDWELSFSWIITEPSSPSIELKAEKPDEFPRFHAFGDSIEEAVNAVCRQAKDHYEPKS